jgi:hypothetical protein
MASIPAANKAFQPHSVAWTEAAVDHAQQGYKRLLAQRRQMPEDGTYPSATLIWADEKVEEAQRVLDAAIVDWVAAKSTAVAYLLADAGPLAPKVLGGLAQELTTLPSAELDRRWDLLAWVRGFEVMQEAQATTAAPAPEAYRVEPLPDSAQQTLIQAPRPRRQPRLTIEKVRAVLLERARRGELITQELVAEDLQVSARTLRKTVAGPAWNAEVRRAVRQARGEHSANGS